MELQLAQNRIPSLADELQKGRQKELELQQSQQQQRQQRQQLEELQRIREEQEKTNDLLHKLRMRQ